MDAFKDFFPPGFWKMMVTSGAVVFFLLGVDLLLGAKALRWLGQTMNKKFHVDQVVVKGLAMLKQTSDKEFDTERSLMDGWGRFFISGLLLCCGVMMLMLLVPRLN